MSCGLSADPAAGAAGRLATTRPMSATDLVTDF
jgi:hypothetical protein